MTPNETTFLAERTLVDGVLQPEIAITVAGGKITRVSPASELAPDADVRRFPRRLLMPGTLNAHNHSFQSMLRGIADDCDFFTWRDKALYAYSPHMDEEAVYHGARFAFAEMIRNGVTTVCDFFYIHRGGNENDHAVIRAARDLGMRIVLAPHDVRLGRRADRVSGDDRRGGRRARASYGRHISGRDDVHVLPAPHSPHGASPAMIQAGSTLAEELGTRFHMHVAEGRYERDTIREKYGKTPIRWLESLASRWSA